MKLSEKNTNFIIPKTMIVGQLLDNKDIEKYGNLFSLIIQPIDGRRIIVLFTKKMAGELGYRLLKISEKK